MLKLSKIIILSYIINFINLNYYLKRYKRFY